MTRQSPVIDPSGYALPVYCRLFAINVESQPIEGHLAESDPDFARWTMSWLQVPVATPGYDVLTLLAALVTSRLDQPDEVPLLSIADGPTLAEMIIEATILDLPVALDYLSAWCDLQCTRLGAALGHDPAARSRLWQWVEALHSGCGEDPAYYPSYVQHSPNRDQLRRQAGTIEDLEREIAADHQLITAFCIIHSLSPDSLIHWLDQIQNMISVMTWGLAPQRHRR